MSDGPKRFWLVQVVKPWASMAVTGPFGEQVAWIAEHYPARPYPHTHLVELWATARPLHAHPDRWIHPDVAGLAVRWPKPEEREAYEVCVCAGASS